MVYFLCRYRILKAKTTTRTKEKIFYIAGKANALEKKKSILFINKLYRIPLELSDSVRSWFHIRQKLNPNPKPEPYPNPKHNPNRKPKLTETQI